MGIQCPHCGMQMGGVITITDKPSGEAKCPFCEGSIPSGTVLRVASREEGERLKVEMATAFLDTAANRREKSTSTWAYILLAASVVTVLGGLVYVLGWR